MSSKTSIHFRKFIFLNEKKQKNYIANTVTAMFSKERVSCNRYRMR